MGLVFNAARALPGELQSGKNCDLKCFDNTTVHTIRQIPKRRIDVLDRLRYLHGSSQ
jgi:hypothetical protein